MAKKAKSTRPAEARSRAATPAQTLAPRPAPNPGVPRVQFTAQPTVTHDMIARRAFEIHCADTGGSTLDDWLRAERELRQELGLHAPQPAAEGGSCDTTPSSPRAE